MMGRSNPEFIGNGYLYSLWKGYLSEYPGKVSYRPKEMVDGHIYEEEAYFTIISSTGKEIRTVYCSRKEGILFNRFIWLSNSNRKQAADILIEYELTEIDKLKLKISDREKIIETLRLES